MASTSGLGMWEDRIETPSGRGKKEKFRANVPPLQGYTPPEALRSFCELPRIGFDIEGWDPNLKTQGPGAHRDEGKVTGVAVAYSPDDAEYYPVAHAHQNMGDPEKFFNHLRDESAKFKGELVGANLQYDLDWMWKRHNVRFPKAKIRDVQIAEPLLDENRMTYKLNALSKDYLGEGKYTDVLAEVYGEDYISNMHMVDAGYAAEYAKGDTTIPWQILDKQYIGLEAQGLTDLFHLESRLTPLLVQMRQVGVRVDLDVAQQAYDMTVKEAEKFSQEIQRVAGFPVDVWSADSVARAFDNESIEYPKTKTGRPSFRKAWLEAHPSKLANLIVDQRGFEKIGSTFLNNYILKGAIQHGDEHRIHCMFNQLRSDDSGAVSGRFSSSYPNLQNIPVRHPILGPLLRSVFIPEEGTLWGSADWSQIEYRFLVHYASLLRAKGADQAVRMYREDKNTDFHDLASHIAGVPRGDAKSINFGVVYGMGVTTMATNLNKSLTEAKGILENFHGEMPFMKSTFNTASGRAALKGEIRTILGRKRRFDQWEVQTRTKSGKFAGVIFRSLEAATEYREDITSKGGFTKPARRAFTHKALNALLQGSAADLMKKAMVEMYEAGIFEVLVPHLTVHDEMNSSVPDTKEGREAFAESVHIMETSLELNVPVLADAKLGSNWSEAH